MTVALAQEIAGKDAKVYLKERGVMHWIDDGKTNAIINIEISNE